MTKKILIASVAIGIIILGLFGIVYNRGGVALGGAQLVQNSNPIFSNGLRGGGIQSAVIQVIDATGNLVGVVNTALSATFTGTTRIKQPVETGSKTILTGAVATTSVTAAQICAGSYFEWSPSVANATATLPSASALGAACLTTTGDRLPYIVWKNTSVSASSTIFAAGASTTLAYVNASTTAGGSPGTLLGGKYASLRFLVTSSTDPTSGVTVLISQFQ
jgi:hypothetical protein